jgi:hypothetical protein
VDFACRLRKTFERFLKIRKGAHECRAAGESQGLMSHRVLRELDAWQATNSLVDRISACWLRDSPLYRVITEIISPDRMADNQWCKAFIMPHMLQHGGARHAYGV